MRQLMIFASLSAVLCGQAWGQSPDYEDTAAKYQSTFNWQTHPAFGSSVNAGPNSLLATRDTMYTFSATAHWGFRPWAGGEIYFNPEVVSGVPFSNNLIGLGGFTNGEITRAGGTDLSFYRQRLFLRQTWNQGGGSEKIASDFNQMAGTLDTNRFVLTAGNFSTLDVFDDNTYAKDPRTQFMNWGNWTYAAYDYAADARGYGWGFAAEWYRGDWVLRVGRMTGPVDPNGLEVDFALDKHYGDQIELERAHLLGDLPGKARLLLWRNRAVLGSYTDATAYLRANPTANPQTIVQVRQGEKTKSGVGINIEQALTPHSGFFLRAMQADGATETHAFTEVDASLSTGVLVNGAAWGRAQDSVGLSVMQNRLSDERRTYLEAGGISFFIGDGANAYSYQPESIFEGFYSWGFYKNTSLTLDYQRIANPGYNANRGPVNVMAFRLHTEF